MPDLEETGGQENEQEKFTLLFVITGCSATMQDKCYQLHY